MKKKTKNKIFTIQLDIYDAQITVAVGVSKEEMNKYIDKYSIVRPSQSFIDALEDLSDSTMGKAILDTETHWNILWLKNEIKTPYDYGTLAHEASHLAHFILDKMGVEWSVDNDEVVCYTVGYIVKEILAVLKRG